LKNDQSILELNEILSPHRDHLTRTTRQRQHSIFSVVAHLWLITTRKKLFRDKFLVTK